MKVYLDIDGVLLANEHYAANHVHEFLEYVTKNYDTYWLTTHCRGNTETAIDRLREVFEPETLKLTKNIKSTNWQEAKTEAIDFSVPFLWFDDDLFDDEREELVRHGVLDNWIEVDLSKDVNQLQELLRNFPLHIRAA